MNRSTLRVGTVIIALLCCGACSAPWTSEDSQRESDRLITLSGCLEGSGYGAGSGKTAETSSRAGDSAGEQFTLTDAGAVTHLLNGKADELRPHVNQQVEVIGRLSATSDSSNSRDGARETAGDSGEAVGRSPLRDHVRVESVRMLAPGCSK